MASRPTAANAAERAEPRSIGSASARDPLAREVKLLGALLGQVIVEQAGADALELVEDVRRATIAARRGGGGARARRRLSTRLDAISLAEAETLIRAFSLYFQLTNLAEEKQRIRRLRQRQRQSVRGVVPESIADAVTSLRRAGLRREDLDALLGRLRVAPVLTAHPTEARRRTILVALRRIYALLDRLDDPRLTPAEDADLRRRLREEISLLWNTSPLRATQPGPLDEVRSAMVFFDESLFVVTPRIYRELDRALDEQSPTGTRPPRVGAYLGWGSWIGGDRDGNPQVTAEVTRHTLRIQADHVLRAYEQVCRRLMQTVAVTAAMPAALEGRLADDSAALPATARELERRFPDEPYRQRFGYIAERLRRTRSRLTRSSSDARPADDDAGGYGSPAELAAELAELAEALVSGSLGRAAYGGLQELRWQLDTFGFHGPSLEVRQHSAVHSATLAATSDDVEVSRGVTAGEVLSTFAAISDLQLRYGADACRRYVVSFTHGVDDVLNVLRLARRAAKEGGIPALDVVPLFESADALLSCRRIIEDLFTHPEYRAHLAERGGQQEVMLGYSDSTKESGGLAGAWMLYRAQAELVQAARSHDVRLTLFHGRGGAIGRGGGPMTRAALAQAAGSVGGGLKLTEQGEVIADRYANPAIAMRHLEQLCWAALLASTAEHDEAAAHAATDGAAVLDELADEAQRAYRALVWEDPGFEAYFRAATPIAELAQLAIGSRPAARGSADEPPRLQTLRAIPWVFAWSQSRANLPGWYGIGSALEAFRERHGEGSLDRLQALYRSWPFFASLLDNAEMILAKADMLVARRYSALAPTTDARRTWRQIRTEYERSVTQILAVTGRMRLLDDLPVLQRSIELRNPYVDSLSELQVRLLGRLRALAPDDSRRPELLRLVHLTVSGVAAGLQNTG